MSIAAPTDLSAALSSADSREDAQTGIESIETGMRLLLALVSLGGQPQMLKTLAAAAEARIGLVDRIFTRVGASDNLAGGLSTFMVEMVETAAILNQSGSRALVILDEIGRGTATYDGLSIAWAVIEHLHEVNRCRALFATHYHELVALAGRLTALANYTVRVKQWQGDVVFLHEVVRGAAEASYGIQVAKLAGLPAAVIARAGEVLEHLEKDEPAAAPARLASDLPLFSALPRPSAKSKTSRAEEELAKVRPDDLSPKQALELVYKLRGLLNEP